MDVVAGLVSDMEMLLDFHEAKLRNMERWFSEHPGEVPEWRMEKGRQAKRARIEAIGRVIAHLRSEVE